MEDKIVLECVNASGFGGTYLKTIIAGLKYLKGKDPNKYSIKQLCHPNIFPSGKAGNNFTKGLYKAVAEGDPDTSGEFQIACNHCQLIFERGYNNYMNEVKARNKLTTEKVSQEIYDLFHSFKGKKS